MIHDSEILKYGERVDIVYYPKKPRQKNQQPAELTIWTQAGFGGASGNTVNGYARGVTITDVFQTLDDIVHGDCDPTKTTKWQWYKYKEPSYVPKRFEFTFGELINRDGSTFLLVSVLDYAKEFFVNPSYKNIGVKNGIKTMCDISRIGLPQMSERTIRISHDYASIKDCTFDCPNSYDIIVFGGKEYECESRAEYGMSWYSQYPIMPFCFYREYMKDSRDMYFVFHLSEVSVDGS